MAAVTDDLIVVAVGLACVPTWLVYAMAAAAAVSVGAACWAVRA